MPRTARASAGGYCYHVLNRGNARAKVFRCRTHPACWLLIRCRFRGASVQSSAAIDYNGGLRERPCSTGRRRVRIAARCRSILRARS